MNERVEKAKQEIANAFVCAQTFDEAKSILRELQKFLYDGFEFAIDDILTTPPAPQTELCEMPDKTETSDAFVDCRECARYFTCEMDRIIEQRLSGKPCKDFKHKNQ